MNDWLFGQGLRLQCFLCQEWSKLRMRKQINSAIGDNSTRRLVGVLSILIMATTGCQPSPPAAEFSWSEPQLISSQDVGSAAYPDVAMAQNGEAMVVWLQAGGGGSDDPYNVYAARYRPGFGWGAPQKVSNATTPDESAVEVAVAVDASANAYVAWSQGFYEVWASSYTDEAGWTAPVSFNPGSTDPKYSYLSLAADAIGGAICVWQQAGHVWAGRHDPTEGWGAPERLSDATYSAYESPAIAMEPLGSALAVWVGQNDADQTNTLVSRYRPNVGWSAPVAIGDANEPSDSLCNPIPCPNGNSNPAAAMNAGADPMAVWMEYHTDTQTSVVLANSFVGNSAWGSPAPISPDLKHILQANLASSETGRAMATWWPWYGEVDIWSTAYSPEDGWGSPEIVHSSPTGDMDPHNLAIAPDGTAYITWGERPGFYWEVWSNRYDPSTGWEGAVRLDADASGGSGAPQVAADHQGHAIVTWTECPTDLCQIMARRYE
jgi:hypothetical protein